MPVTEQEIRKFIVDNFLFGRDDGKLKSDTSFLDSGIIDSTGVMELVMFVERTCGIKIEDHDLDPANLDSISRLVKFIERKQAAQTIGAPRAASGVS
jgi:acyl carrier protein